VKLADIITESRGHKIIAAKLKDIESRNSQPAAPEQHICNLAPQLKTGGCTACRRLKQEQK
jgi:hypothetical protein